MFLVDSTFYIELLRAGQDPVEALYPWLNSEEVVSCGVVRCEVLRGIVKRTVHKRMRELFAAMLSVEMDTAMWEEVADLSWRLDRRGIVLPLADLMIGCCALRAGATIVSSDRHFRKIPNLSFATAFPRP